MMLKVLKNLMGAALKGNLRPQRTVSERITWMEEEFSRLSSSTTQMAVDNTSNGENKHRTTVLLNNNIPPEHKEARTKLFPVWEDNTGKI